MQFTNAQEEKIRHMITKGDKIEAIAKAIGGNCTWLDVQQFCWATGAMSWQGSKKMISTRLKRFKTATTQQLREQLAAEIDELTSYLYNCSKQMRERITAVENALKKIK